MPPLERGKTVSARHALTPPLALGSSAGAALHHARVQPIRACTQYPASFLGLLYSSSHGEKPGDVDTGCLCTTARICIIYSPTPFCAQRCTFTGNAETANGPAFSTHRAIPRRAGLKELLP